MPDYKVRASSKHQQVDKKEKLNELLEEKKLSASPDLEANAVGS